MICVLFQSSLEESDDSPQLEVKYQARCTVLVFGMPKSCVSMATELIYTVSIG